MQNNNNDNNVENFPNPDFGEGRTLSGDSVDENTNQEPIPTQEPDQRHQRGGNLQQTNLGSLPAYFWHTVISPQLTRSVSQNNLTGLSQRFNFTLNDNNDENNNNNNPNPDNMPSNNNTNNNNPNNNNNNNNTNSNNNTNNRQGTIIGGDTNDDDHTSEGERHPHNLRDSQNAAPQPRSNRALDDDIQLDIPSFLLWVNQNMPYFVIFFLYFLFWYFLEILAFVTLFFTFERANNAIKQEVKAKEKRNVFVLIVVISGMALTVGTVYLLYRPNTLWLLLIGRIPAYEHESAGLFLEIMWSVAVNDFVARYIAVSLKAVVTVVIPLVLSNRKCGQIYSFLEVSCDLYRFVIPAPQWLYFFSLQRNPVGIYFFFGLVIANKARGAIERLLVVLWHIKMLMSNQAQYGKYITMQDLAERGETTCSICQDNYSNPVALQCNHCFCEDCVAQWLDKEKTCPICRTAISAAGLKLHADGSTSGRLVFF